MAGKELKNGTPGKKPDALLKTLKAGNGLVSALAGLLAVVLILYSGYVLYDSFATEYGAYSDNQDLLKYKPVVMANGKAAEGAEDLSAVNADYRAWLTVDNTQIDYPVVQGRDDLFYASHDAYGGPSLSGAIYLAAANSPNFRDSYSVVYGHHMDNGAMFGSLDRFRDSGYFHEHQAGTVITKDNVYTLTLFAVATTDAYENQVYSVGDRAREVISFLTGDRRGDAGIGTNVLIYDREAAAGAVKVVALSTCADANTNGRLVVFGKLEETATVTLTVHYEADGVEVFPTGVYVYHIGETYYVVSPQLPGYDVDIEIVRGTITEDLEITVHYIPKTWQMVIHYIFPDGTEAAETYTAEIRTGEEYDIASPEIPGYIAVKVRISGTNPGRSEEYTVVYIPVGEYTKITGMDDYEAPTGLGGTYIQNGICFE